MADEDFPDALPARYKLHWYVLERVLGQGGFGITYLAHDTNLDRPVAIKEYLPTEVARRRSDASARPRTETHNERYAWGLERFLSEARTLARFDHPNIVRVLSVFEANNTAYMVMRFEEGEDLATLLERRGTLPEEQLLSCLFPILDGLQLIHSSGFIHRDIKPENIYVRHDGSPVLLDFGSARQSFGSAKTMTILVAPGYAPLEQYYGDAKTQGAWTDIYGLGATCYRAVAGRAPLDAIARAKGVLGSTRDILQPALDVGRGRYSERLLGAIDHALQLSERNRPQSIAEWRADIIAPAASQAASAQAVTERVPTMAPPAAAVFPAEGERVARPRVRTVWPAVAGLCVVGAAAVYVASSRRQTSADPATTPARAATPAALPAIATAASNADEPPASAPLAKPAVAPLSMAALPAAPLPAARSPVDTPSSPPPARATKSSVQAPNAGRSMREATPAASAGVPAVRAPVVVAAAAPSVVKPSPPAALVKPPLAVGGDASLSTAAAASAVPVLSPVQVAALPAVSTRSARDEQLDNADAALRRGDGATAARLLAPLAAAGIPRAQALLGRAHELRGPDVRSDFEAYIWYGIAARNGEAGAAAARDKLVPRLQPAEIRQANQIVERWRPRAEPAVPINSDRNPP